MSWGLLFPAVWMLIFAWFAVDGWSVSKGGSLICALGALICLLVLVGCTSQPSCYDNPRNMRCMSGPELSRALANE